MNHAVDAKRLTSRHPWHWLVPLALFGAAILVGLLYDPWRNPILDDLAIFAYRARMAAEGIPPHAGLYDAKSSLGILLGGAAIAAGNLVGMPPLLALRSCMLVVYGLSVVATFGMAYQYTSSRTAAIIAAIFMLSFEALARYAATSVEPKEVMIVLGLASLYAASERRWFWAGLGAAGAGLAWQVGFGFALVAAVLVLAQGTPRGRGILQLVGGVLLALALYSAYFVAYGAWYDMVLQSVIAPFIRAGGKFDLLPNFTFLAERFYAGYRGQVVVAVLALFGWLLQWRRALTARRHAVYLFLTGPRTAGTLLAFHGLLLYTLIDFQNYPDLIPLLPFVALFAAYPLAVVWLKVLRQLRWTPRTRRRAAAAAVLVLFVLVNLNVLLRPPLRVPVRLTWQLQAEAAAELQDRLGDAPVFFLGRDELLFFMDRRPLTRYTFLVKNTDLFIDLVEPGGFKGWLAQVAATQPASIATKRVKKGKFYSAKNLNLLKSWISREYVELQVCSKANDGKVYVRATNVTLFPTAAARDGACFALAR